MQNGCVAHFEEDLKKDLQTIEQVPDEWWILSLRGRGQLGAFDPGADRGGGIPAVRSRPREQKPRRSDLSSKRGLV